MLRLIVLLCSYCLVCSDYMLVCWDKAIHRTVSIGSIRYIRHNTWYDGNIKPSVHDLMQVLWHSLVLYYYMFVRFINISFFSFFNEYTIYFLFIIINYIVSIYQSITIKLWTLFNSGATMLKILILRSLYIISSMISGIVIQVFIFLPTSKDCLIVIVRPAVILGIR